MPPIPVDASLKRVADNFMYHTLRDGHHTSLPDRVYGVMHRRALRGERVDPDSIILFARRMELRVSSDYRNSLMHDMSDALAYARMMLDVKSLTPGQQTTLQRLRKAYVKENAHHLPDGLLSGQIENLYLLGNLYGKGLLD